MPSRPRRAALADVLGLGALLLVLADELRPGLLLQPTIAAGGDTPCHYPTAVWLYDRAPAAAIPRALFGQAQALEASGDRTAAKAARERLLREHNSSPWAQRLRDGSARPGPSAARER